MTKFTNIDEIPGVLSATLNTNKNLKQTFNFRLNITKQNVDGVFLWIAVYSCNIESVVTPQNGRSKDILEACNLAYENFNKFVSSNLETEKVNL